MSGFVIAQLNIARMRYQIDAPEMADFVANLDHINALAEAAPGFVWRFISDSDVEAEVFEADILVNLSTWTDVESLYHYVYGTAHADIMRSRKQWFDPVGTHSVMWWHPSGSPPQLNVAKQRLDILTSQGPGPQAFTFKKKFDAPGQ